MKKSTGFTIGFAAGLIYGVCNPEKVQRIYKRMMSGLKRPALSMKEMITKTAAACDNIIRMEDLDPEDPKDPIDPMVIQIYN